MGRQLTLLLFTLLALLSTPARSNNRYELSPNLPPTAFIGQYYTCNFRVSGLTAPTFSFVNLPSCFTSTSSGSVEGIPDSTGSFSVTVKYQEGRSSGQQVVVLRVTEPNYNASIGQSLNRPN